MRCRDLTWTVLVVLCSAALWTAALWTAADAEPPFVFRDVGDEAGLFPHVAKIAGHGVAWGDVDGDGWPDLYVATFGGHPYDSKANQLFRNVRGKFVLDEQTGPRVFGRASGAVMADLDNDGDLDLYLSNHAIDAAAYKQPHYGAPNYLFRNDGGGRLTDVSVDSASRPVVKGDFAGRSVTVLDYDGDGLLDLLVGECVYQGGEGRTKLLRNLGGLKFQDVTQSVGLPERATGLGVAAADVTGDGWPDLLIVGRDQLKMGRDPGNHLFVNDGHGRFSEVPRSHADFTWEYKYTLDDTTCGVALGDVNRDGWPDVVIGHHFSSPWEVGGVPVRLYLHRGLVDGLPKFEDVTERVGLTPLPMKAPHVEIQDFDNDGWPDIATSIVKFAGGRAHPVIFKNLGPTDGLPRFREEALAVNDFPTAEDKKLGGTGEFFDKMEREGKIVYTAPGPSCDFDRDGRLDLFLANWWVNSRSLLLRNETPGGNWLDVALTADPANSRRNRQGIGAVVKVYAAGKLGDPAALLGCREISAGYGYASGQEAVAHFGLGVAERCDVQVVLPHGQSPLQQRDVAANQRLVLPRPIGPWLPATAYAIPKETTNQGSGYFSIVTGKNGRLYIGTAKYGVGSFLVEFDPATQQMKVVVDTHKAIGTTATGFAAQSKIHTRNNVGASGKIYFATKQGYPEAGKNEKWEDYPGGYPLVYDPATGETKVYPIPVPHHGIISITPDESRGIAYISTCADQRPESSHFMILDLKTGTYRDLIDCHHMFAFIVIDHLGRAYHPMVGGDIARYDPKADKVERLKQTIDGQPPSPDTHLALAETHPINWDISPDGKTLYALAMSGNQLFAYDLTAAGDTLPGRRLGTLVPGAKSTDCRAMCVGPTGEVWAAVTEGDRVEGGVNLQHFVRYRPGESAPVDLGPVAIRNPDYTEFTDKEGKPLTMHHGIHKMPDGTVTTKFVILGVTQGLDGKAYSLALAPYTLVQVNPP